MSAQEEYKVKLEVFEGPLDLLLYLIKKEEVEIYDIPIERITQQYMQYLDLMRMLDLNIAGEFLVMAATLMMIKSRMLLPEEERAEIEEDEDEGDPRWDLVRQLVEYKKFKDAAQHLEVLERHREDVFSREGEHVKIGPDAEVALRDVSLFDLISAFNEVLGRVKREELREIFNERFTVGEKVDAITRLLREKQEIRLTDLFKDMVSRSEMICTFLAMLELIRMNQVRAVQSAPFAEIEIIRAADYEEAKT